MNTSHYRSVSASERRSATNGIHSRTGSGRVRDYERPSVRENGSPVLSDGFDVGSDAASAARKFQLEERRRQKTTITTTTTEAQYKTRSPVKESWSAATRRPPMESRRKSVPDPLPSGKDQHSRETPPWNPIATLKEHSSAPLASRISTIPISRHAPEHLVRSSVADMAVQDQEFALLDDLLYVFLGYEGQYIHFDPKFDPMEEKERLAGPMFRPPNGLDPSLRELTRSMLEMASHYSAMEAFVEVQSREEYGSVNHALCAAIRKLLKDYIILVAQLEAKVINNSNFTLHQMHLSVMPMAQSLAQLYTVAQELLKKNDLLEEDMDESIEDWDAEKAIARLGAAGELLPGSGGKKKCIGGNVLALLTQCLSTYSGDPAARVILEMLLREASRPYMAMLNEWLHHGGVKDPHAEFLIEEKSSINRQGLDEDFTDEYWEKRYSIRQKEVPPQLEAVKDKVLLAGKYLNVVRECGGVNIASSMPNAPQSFDDPRFLDNVSNAYSFANSELLKLLLAKNSLRSRLRSMKHYFFLDRAEFFLYFLELSSSELQKPQSSVNTGKLQSLLDLVLHQPGSIAVADPFKEDVKIKLNKMGLTQWLMEIVNVQGMDPDNPDSMEQYKGPPAGASGAAGKDDGKDILGIDALELDYSVPFPLSLIISRKTVVRYQFIFRYTLALRHLESRLIDSWQVHNKAISWTHKSSDRRIELWKRRAWNLRCRMLVFVQQMLFYATAEVIEPNWQKLMAKVDAAEAFQKGEEGDLPAHRRSKRTVDELMQDHLDMLDSCTKDLGLTQDKLLRLHAKLMTGCTMFAEYTARTTRDLISADPDFHFLHDEPASAASEKVKTKFQQYSGASIPVPDPSRLQRIEEILTKHEDYFNRHLKILIDSLNYFAATETVVLLGLCARLTNAEVQKRDDLML